MKYLILIITFSTLLSCGSEQFSEIFTANSINHEQEQNILGIEDTETSLGLDFTSFNIPFPEGTSFDIVGSGMNFTLPEPFYIVGIDTDGNYYKSTGGSSGTVTCECTGGTGCDPIKNGDDIGCLMKDNCNTCTKSSSKISGSSQDFVEITIMHPDNNLRITDFSQLEHKYFLPGSFLAYAEIEDLLIQIDLLQSELPVMETGVVFINIHGYILAIEVKLDGDNISIQAMNADGGKVNCSCDVSGSCPKEKHWSGGVVWCNSDKCSKCTMTTSIINPDGVEKLLTSNQGKIVLE